MKIIRLLITSFFLIPFAGIMAQEVSMKDCFLSYKRQATNLIKEDNYGFIWFMRNDGYYRFDGKSVELIELTTDFDQPFYHAGADLFPQKNGDYWFAARDAGLVVYKAKEDRFIHKPLFETKDSSIQIYARTVAQVDAGQDRKLISGDNGIWELDEALNIKNHIALSPIVGQKIWYRHNMDEVRKIVFDQKRNCLWIGGKAGLFSYDLSSKKIERYKLSEEFRIPRQDFFLVNDIVLKEDLLICTTWRGGIMTFNIVEKRWEQFIFEDEKDLVSKSGNTQLAKTKNDLFIFAHESREVGYWQPGADFLQPLLEGDQPLERGIGALVDQLGYLWIGHHWEVCRYQIEEEPPIAKSAQIYIRALELEGQIQKKRMNRWDGHTLTVKNAVEDIRFYFRAINPLTYDNINYEYRLEGLDDDWIKNDTSEFAVYKNLASGHYVFQARYWDQLSKKYINTGKLAVQLNTEKQITQYIISGLLVLLALSFLGFFLYRKYQKKREQKAAKLFETQLREVQDAALRAQMNPHFLFNSLNSIRYFIVSNDNQKAADYLTKFSRLIRMILETSKKQLVFLEEEIQLLKLYTNMEQIRFENKFDFIIKMDDEVKPKELLIPPMLLQPYIENAILHGINPKKSRGKIVLEIKRQEAFLIIVISDDGIGREASKAYKKDSILQKKSLGLSITKSRLDLAHTSKHKASMEIVDHYDAAQNPSGTTVILRIPF